MPTITPFAPAVEPVQHPQAQDWTMERLYTEHYAGVLSSVRAFAQCSREEAEDITQETFLKAMQALSTVDTTRPAFPWLYQIAKHTTLDRLRRMRRACRLGAVELSEHMERWVHDDRDLEAETATRESIQRALQSVKPQYREALLLQVVGGYRCEDIAQRLGWTLGQTKTALVRARQAFKQHYEEVPA